MALIRSMGRWCRGATGITMGGQSWVAWGVAIWVAAAARFSRLPRAARWRASTVSAGTIIALRARFRWRGCSWPATAMRTELPGTVAQADSRAPRDAARSIRWQRARLRHSITSAQRRTVRTGEIRTQL